MSAAESTPPAAVCRDDLSGDAIPDWVISAALHHEGWGWWAPDEEPTGVDLVWAWVLDTCGLPAVYRIVLDVIARYPSGSLLGLSSMIGRPAGVHADQLRLVILPNLQRWGWLRVARRPNGGYGYTVTVPVDEPPDRVARLHGRRTPSPPSSGWP